jgi:hypothetical protein
MVPRMTKPAPGAGRMPDGGGPGAGKGKPGKLDITIISTLILFGLLLIKVYGVSGFSLETAGALAATQPASVVIGTLALYSYLFMALIADASIYLIFAALALNSDLGKWPWVAAPLALFGILLSPFRYLVDSLVLLLFVLLISWGVAALVGRIKGKNWKKGDWRRPRRLPADTFHRTAACLGAVIVMLFFLGTISQPWLPAQAIKLRTQIAANLTRSAHPPTSSRTRYPVVFVLGGDNGRVELLFDSDRDIVYTKENNILSQRICNLNDELEGSLPLLGIILHERYSPHVISCWRCTDQNFERNKMGPPLFISWLEWHWHWKPVHYPHKDPATHKFCTETAS